MLSNNHKHPTQKHITIKPKHFTQKLYMKPNIYFSTFNPINHNIHFKYYHKKNKIPHHFKLQKKIHKINMILKLIHLTFSTFPNELELTT